VGHEVALLLARKGAHVVVADLDAESAKSVANEVAKISSSDTVASTVTDLANSESLAEVVKFTILQFGGIDAVVNTAAIYPVPGESGRLTSAQWSKTFQINVTGNYLLAEAAEWVFKDQDLPAAIALTSSANALVPKKGTEAYDTSRLP